MFAQNHHPAPTPRSPPPDIYCLRLACILAPHFIYTHLYMVYVCCKTFSHSTLYRLLQHVEPVQYDEEEEDEEEDEGAQQEEDSDEADRRPAKRKRVPVPRPSIGTPAKAESLEEVEQRLQPGSVKHAIFQVCCQTLPPHFEQGLNRV